MSSISIPAMKALMIIHLNFLQNMYLIDLRGFKNHKNAVSGRLKLTEKHEIINIFIFMRIKK